MEETANEKGLKEQILSALREQDAYISGQEMCSRFGVSRTAVWKRINQLKEEGYEISAVPNKGYHLTGSPDKVSPEDILSRLETNWAAREVQCFDTIDSTNQYVKMIAEREGAKEGTLVVADEQTAGKGRLGRVWTTPLGSAIAMSLLLRPQIRPERVSMVTLIAGMAVVDACRELYGIDAGIKWPNDVVVNGKKLSGTLTEMTTDIMSVAFIVVGTGINVNVKSFPEEIRETATSLLLETGKMQNRAALIACIMKYFEKYYETFLKTEDLSALLEHYNELLVSNGRRVKVLDPQGQYWGTAEGADEMGDLLVRRDDGSLERVYAGEVSVRGVYGYV